MCKKINLEISEDDRYWLELLLKQFIEKEANITQIEATFLLYQKIKSVKK